MGHRFWLTGTGKHYELPGDLTYHFNDSPKAAMILRPDPHSPLFGGHRVVDTVDLNGHTERIEERLGKIETMIFKSGGKLTNRPYRPSQEFLQKIGIRSIPDNVDIRFQDGSRKITPPERAFIITLVDEDDDPVKFALVDAWDDRTRSPKQIYAEIRDVLVNEFGAEPTATIHRLPERTGPAARR